MNVIPPNANFNSILYPLIEVVVSMLVIMFVAAILYKLIFKGLPASIYNFGYKLVLTVGALLGLYIGLKIVGD